MQDRASPDLLEGTRAPALLGLAVILPSGLLCCVVGMMGLGERPVAGAAMLALGAFMLVNAVDWLARSISPNRLRLDRDGLELVTWRGVSRWPWTDYRGVYGIGHQMLEVETGDGRVRAIPIGHWQRDLAVRLADHAAARGVVVARPALVRPSTVPLFVLGSGLVDHSQKITVAARATAEKKAVGQRS